jgi:hypothetical protein
MQRCVVRWKSTDLAPKRPFIFNRLHCVISQKTELLKNKVDGMVVRPHRLRWKWHSISRYLYTNKNNFYFEGSTEMYTENMCSHYRHINLVSVRFEILVSVNVKFTVFWNLTLLNLGARHQRFCETCCHHYQGRRWMHQNPPKRG